MIALRTYERGDNSIVVIHEKPDSELTEAAARVSRTALLSGGVSITHRGFDHGDRTFRVKAEIDESVQTILEDMRDRQVYLLADMRDGTFVVVMERIKFDRGELELTLMVKERVET